MLRPPLSAAPQRRAACTGRLQHPLQRRALLSASQWTRLVLGLGVLRGVPHCRSARDLSHATS
eukprot:155191-Pyramimonas_sp.AAC.1